MIAGLRPQLAEAGKIKIGGLGKEQTSQKGRKYRAPKKYDSFWITKNYRDGNGELVPDRALMRVIPKDPDERIRSIPIILHSDDIDTVFPTAYACYAGRKLECRGDGRTAMRWDAKRTKQEEVQCPCPMLNAKGPKTCKPHGTLHCSVMVPGHAVAGAVHRWRTTSIISLQRMIGSLQQILATVGVLRGVPLRLRVEPVTVSPGDTTTTVYCCHVELNSGDIRQVQDDAMTAAKARKALANGEDLDAQYKQLVAAPGLDEGPEEQADVQDEFHPEQQAREPSAKTLKEKLQAQRDEEALG